MHKITIWDKRGKKFISRVFQMKGKNGVVIWVQWFDFSFSEEECMRV